MKPSFLLRHGMWMLVSLLLLVIYLGFFYACLGKTYPTNIVIGVVSWLIWVAVCVGQRGIFLNQFEYWVHQLVGLDLLFEGFVPVHEGYGFYYCALSFWIVLLGNHFVLSRFQKTVYDHNKLNFKHSGG